MFERNNRLELPCLLFCAALWTVRLDMGTRYMRARRVMGFTCQNPNPTVPAEHHDMPNEDQDHHTLLPFLQSQSQNTLTRLYQRPSSCLSILRLRFTWTLATNRLTCVCRLLRPLEKQIIMNLLWLESAINATTMAAWVTRESRKYIALFMSSRMSCIYEIVQGL